MTEQARREHAEVIRARYQEADKRERGAMLDEYCRVTGCHRKAAIRRLRAAPQRPRRGSGRPPRYGRDLLPLLAQVWQASDYLSGKLLRPIVPALVSARQRHHGLVVSAAAHAALLAASPATLDRRLRPLRRRRRPGPPRRVATALHAVRAQVPRRTWSEWTGVTPGAVQGDLVLHCGEITEGRYCATLVAVDVATTWTERQAIWGLHQQRVTGGIQHVHQRLPFPLREWHSDNGSEFVNACLLGWCRHRGIRFTRARPYRKNDQAWVEQRNGLLVRRLVGSDRYSSRAAWRVLQRRYGLLRLQHNFFRPVRKLVTKRPVGSRVPKRYDAPQTPYQHVSTAGGLSPEQQRALAQECHAGPPRPGSRHSADAGRAVEAR